MGPLVDTELPEEPACVALDGVVGEVELPSDVRVAQSLADAAEYLQFASRDTQPHLHRRPDGDVPSREKGPRLKEL